jgi:tyrocidine synthetase III
MIVHLQELVKSVIADIHIPLHKLNYLGEEEQHRLLHIFNDTRLAHPVGQTLQSMFEQQASLTPDAIALVYEQTTLSYRELNERSNQLAHYLREQYDIKPNDLVGVMTDRSEQMVIGMLGILKSGAGYVAIDPAYPEERIRYIIEDSQSRVVVTQPLYEKYLTGQQYLDLDGSTTLLKRESKHNPDKVNQGSDLSYLIYTSGSTGHPKGIEITHDNVVSFLYWSWEEFKGSDFSIVYAVTSYCFDLSVYEIFYPLSIGRPVRLLSSGLSIKDYLDTDQKILLNTVPSVIETLLRMGTSFSKVNVINMAGEPISRYVKDHLDGDRIEVRNLYGPSEDTTYSSCYRFRREDSIIPIGRPIGNTKFYIVDDHGSLQGEGIPGELCISGLGLARGYYRRADLTSLKFIDNPFEAGSRLYKTGDIARWLSDGNVEYLGRKDNQIKLRGYRIELGEIENAMLSYAGIDQAVVVVRMVSSEKQLVGYYTGAVAESQPLKNHLSKVLPAYMIPSHFMLLESLPLNNNGKIDRKALPDPKLQDETQQSTTPVNAIEEQLVNIWSELIPGKQQIGTLDNFFDLGGHSLKAMQIVSRVHKEMDVKIELRDFFIDPTIKGLAKIVAQSSADIYDEIVPVPEQAHYEASSGQKQLWMLNLANKDMLAYNLSLPFVFHGDLNPQALEKAVHTLVQRHEILRTTIIDIGGEPRQKIHDFDSAAYSVTYLDFRNNPSQQMIETRLDEEAETVFDLAKGRLFKAKVFHLEDRKFMFLITMHHIITDGWSVTVLLDELTTLYACYSRGLGNPLPPLKIQYKDYVYWHNKKVNARQWSEHQKYWHDQFREEVPVLDFPTDYARGPLRTYNGDSINGFIEKETLENLKHISKHYGTTIFMMILTSIKALLYRYTGQNDIIIGSPVAGRDHANLENQLGMFINTLALRTKLADDETLETLLLRVKNVTLNAYAHQDYPFDSLVREINIKRQKNRAPLFDVIVAFQNIEIDNRNRIEFEEDFIVENYNKRNTVSAFDLMLTAIEGTAGLYFTLTFNTDIFNESSMQVFMSRLQNVMECLALNPSVKIDDLLFSSIDNKVSTNEVDAFFNNTY